MSSTPAAPRQTDHQPQQEAPWYLPQGDEVELFEAAWRARLPVLLKGPTGCGKTRFIEHMAWQLSEQLGRDPEAGLITVACHDDLTATDLVGRYLLKDDETQWIDGPLTRAARTGALCYLDEIVEARRDTTVLIHALTDHRRLLPIEKTGELLSAHEDFRLVISYNPGYQSRIKDLKPSTRQRFISLEFDYPEPETEAQIIVHESGVDTDTAMLLAQIGQRTRNLADQGFEDGVSTRLLVYAGAMIQGGVDARRACDIAIARALTDDADVHGAVSDIIDVLIPQGV